MKDMIDTTILKVEGSAVVKLCGDKKTDTYSIGVNSKEGFQWKFISKKLHNLLVKELLEQNGKPIKR